MLDDVQLERYSRQIILPQVDLIGQERLLASRVLVVGAGGIGCPLVLYLARSGVGAIEIVDSDSIELSNLPRQIAYQLSDVGSRKAQVLAREAKASNPDIQVEAHESSLRDFLGHQNLSRFSLVIDATDSVAAARDLNRAAVSTQTPLLYVSATGTEGRIFVSEGWRSDQPCIECLLGPSEREEQGCQTMGVLSPSVGAIAVLAAVQALKVLLDRATAGVFCLDTWTFDTMRVALNKDPACAACGAYQRG